MVVDASGRHNLTGFRNNTAQHLLMKKLLDFSFLILPWLMIIMVLLTVATMLVILYQKKQHHQKADPKP